MCTRSRRQYATFGPVRTSLVRLPSRVDAPQLEARRVVELPPEAAQVGELELEPPVGGHADPPAAALVDPLAGAHEGRPDARAEQLGRPLPDAVDRVAGVQQRVAALARSRYMPHGCLITRSGHRSCRAFGPMQGFSAGGCGSCDGPRERGSGKADGATQRNHESGTHRHSCSDYGARNARVEHRRRRNPRSDPGDRPHRGRAADRPPGVRAVRPDRRNVDRRHPRLRAVRARSAARVRGREALRGRGPGHLQPLALPAHPERRRPARREVRRRRARPRARAVPRAQAAVPDEAGPHRAVLRHERARPVLLQDDATRRPRRTTTSRCTSSRAPPPPRPPTSSRSSRASARSWTAACSPPTRRCAPSPRR